jgi:hypothetical protein
MSEYDLRKVGACGAAPGGEPLAHRHVSIEFWGFAPLDDWRRIRQIRNSFLLVVSLALCQQSNNPPFKIAITAENSTIAAGADVSIKVSLTNTSDKDVYEGVMYMDGIGLDTTFRFEVRDEHGKLVPQRIYPYEELRTGKVIFRTIWAGQTLTQPQTVSARYDMRKPGKYTIQVSRGVSDNPKDDIKSNIVTVTVTPNDKDPARSPS